MKVDGKPVELTSFYYVEPNVSQTISFCTLIPQPRELLQVFVQFSMSQMRLFPKKIRLPGGLFPHSSAKTYQVNSRGLISGVKDDPLTMRP
jgi:hypothetical protein